MRHIVIIVLAGAALSLAWSRAALGQSDTNVTPADQARAKEHFDRAQAHKTRGDRQMQAGAQAAAQVAYGDAAEAYHQAFDAYPHPAFAYNEAQMRRLRGEHEQALAAYERYLALDPDGAKADEVRAHIAALRTEVTSQGPAAAPGEPTAAAMPTSAPASPEATDTPEANGRASPRLRLAGITVAATGAAALAIGVGFGLDARATSDELSQRPEAWEPRHAELFAAGKRAERRMFIALGVGATAIAAGAVLYVLGQRDSGTRESPRAGLSVRVAPTHDGAAVAVSGRF
ncbi:hypothetical protein [Haliangium sp.]|uniref:hypothetical protein n=1 Tax=Haliangium sp. TaxID=2663208 RepID=UPI003D09D3C2